MSRTQTYADILLNLPVDDTLKTFIERHAMPLPEGWIWHDSIQASKSLVGLIQLHPNAAMRDRIVAGLHASTLLAHAGRPCEAKPLQVQAITQGMALAQRTADVASDGTWSVTSPTLANGVSTVQASEQPSPLSVFSTLRFKPGVMRVMTSLKLSRSICTNLRSFKGLSGSVG